MGVRPLVTALEPQSVKVLCVLSDTGELLWVQPSSGLPTATYQRTYLKRLLGPQGLEQFNANEAHLNGGYIKLFEVTCGYWESIKDAPDVHLKLAALNENKKDEGYLKSVHQIESSKKLTDRTLYVLKGTAKTGYWITNNWSHPPLKKELQVDNQIRLDPDFGNAIVWSASGACTVLDLDDVSKRWIQQYGVSWAERMSARLQKLLEDDLQMHYEVRVDWSFSPGRGQSGPYRLFDWSAFYAKACCLGYMLDALSDKHVLIGRSYEEWQQQRYGKVSAKIKNPGGWFLRGQEKERKKNFMGQECALGVLDGKEQTFMLDLLERMPSEVRQCAYIRRQEPHFWTQCIGRSKTPRLHWIAAVGSASAVRTFLEQPGMWEAQLASSDIFGTQFLDLLLLSSKVDRVEAWLDEALKHKKQAREYLKGRAFESAPDFEQRMLGYLLFEIKESEQEQKQRVLEKVRTLMGGAFRANLMQSVLEKLCIGEKGGAPWRSLWEKMHLERMVKNTGSVSTAARRL